MAPARAVRSWCGPGPGSSTGAVVSSANDRERSSASPAVVRVAAAGARQRDRPSRPASIGHFDTLPGVNLRPAIQRQVIRILRHQNLGDGGFRRHAAFDQSRRRAGLHDTIFATPAGVFGTAGEEHPELGRHNVQPLALVFADRPGSRGRSCCRYRRRSRPVANAPATSRGWCGASRPVQLAQSELTDPRSPHRSLPFARRLRGRAAFDFGQRLRPAAKPVTLQFLDDLTQPLVLHPLGEQHRFQRLGIVGQCIARHDQIRSCSSEFCHGFRSV